MNKLGLKWTFSIPLWSQFLPDTPYFRENMRYFGLETVPIVADGIMYVTGPNQAFALDARTGHQIWHYSRPRTSGLVSDASLGTNRGVAILGDKVFMVTDNAHLIALNRVTGQPRMGSRDAGRAAEIRWDRRAARGQRHGDCRRLGRRLGHSRIYRLLITPTPANACGGTGPFPPKATRDSRPGKEPR